MSRTRPHRRYTHMKISLTDFVFLSAAGKPCASTSYLFRVHNVELMKKKK